jgi:hypothetical protein
MEYSIRHRNRPAAALAKMNIAEFFTISTDRRKLLHIFPSVDENNGDGF